MSAGNAPRITVATDSRTRSVWLTQLVLGATVVIMSVLVIALHPSLFGRWNFGLGVLMIVAITMATLALPWSRLSQRAVLVIPFLDALAIGLIASHTELRLGYFWALPVMWVATHFSAGELAAMLATIGAILLADTAVMPTPDSWLRLLIVLLSLAFIGITAHLATRQPRALRILLQRQATRLNRTLERRSAQERRTTEILNGIDMGVARISAAGKVLSVNTAYSDLYGIDVLDPNLPARSVEYDSFRGIPLPTPSRPFARAARGEVFSDLQVWLHTETGQWHVLSTSSKRLESSENEERTMLLLVRDVTAVADAQRERDRLTAIASHELAHPLTVMISTADLALEADELTPHTRERMETILRASERMLEMTSSMLRTSNGRFAAAGSFEEIELDRILGESVGAFDATARAREVTLDVTTSESLPVIADGFRMRQVVDNLVGNAIKYTPTGGLVRVIGSLDGDDVSLTVADTGIGVSAEDLPRILTPYFRTAQARTTASGTGLGLSITNEIVTAHGGTLSISSTERLGTSIEVRLPHAWRTATAHSRSAHENAAP